MKLYCNVFYASKIQIFTEFYLCCQKVNISFDRVVQLMLENKWIHPMHTQVPGPDGKISYGGLCFPKDIQALLFFMNEKKISCKVIQNVIEEQKLCR